MLSKLLEPEIRALIDSKDWKNLKEIIREWEIPEIAELIHTLEPKDAVLVYKLLPQNISSDVFAEMDADMQETLVNGFANKELKQLIVDLSPDDRTELFEELPVDLTQKILNLLPAEERKEALQLLGYPEKSVGRLMTPDYISVQSDWDVKQVLEYLHTHGRDAETINMIYVVDTNSKLLDDIPIRKFILSEPGLKVKNIMDGKFISVLADSDQENAYHIMKKYRINALPVVNSSNSLLGIVTIDDIIEILEEEITEDFQKLSAINPVEENYFRASPFLLYRKRVFWLMLLLVSGFLSSNIISYFESSIHTVIALAFFIPVLIDSGGNTASQSSTLVIRAIATGEFTLNKWFSVVKKEFITGLLLGVTLGIMLFIRSYFWQGGVMIGLVVGLSMMMIIIWANLLGSVLPLVLSKYNLDPAVISSPLLTTVVDASGLYIYFILASWLLNL